MKETQKNEESEKKDIKNEYKKLFKNILEPVYHPF
jgi:hypothetical protein